jgi:hypothetical protein
MALYESFWRMGDRLLLTPVSPPKVTLIVDQNSTSRARFVARLRKKSRTRAYAAEALWFQAAGSGATRWAAPFGDSNAVNSE